MAASPVEPAGGVAGRFRAVECGGEQALDLADGERDQPGVCGRRVARAGRRRRLGAGAFPQLGGGRRTTTSRFTTRWETLRRSRRSCAWPRHRRQRS